MREPVPAAVEGRSQDYALKYWEAQELTGHYPRLARLAKRVFCVHASEAASERVFSIAGLLSGDERANISPETLGNRVVVAMNSVARLKFVNGEIEARNKKTGGHEPLKTLLR